MFDKRTHRFPEDKNDRSVLYNLSGKTVHNRRPPADVCDTTAAVSRTGVRARTTTVRVFIIVYRIIIIFLVSFFLLFSFKCSYTTLENERSEKGETKKKKRDNETRLIHDVAIGKIVVKKHSKRSFQ